MTNINNDPLRTPEVQDKRSRPSGLLPKNTQTWLVIGLAVLMAAIIAFSGRSSPKEKHTSTAPATLPVVDPNATRIQNYQHDIDEQARKLQLEQAELARTQKAMGTPAGALGSASTPYSIPIAPGYARPGEPRSLTPEPGKDEGSFQAEMKKREYQSLFASNVAVSYRKEMLTGASLASAPSGFSGFSAGSAYSAPPELSLVSRCQRQCRSFRS